MSQVNLRLKDRDTGTEVPYVGRELYDEDYLFGRQDALSEIYKRYDVLCLCQSEAVRMHVKFRLDTGNYYLADNPSSPNHREGCELEKSRRVMESVNLDGLAGNEDIWNLPDNYNLLKSANSDAKGDRARKSTAKHSVKQPCLFKRLVSTLLDESFATFYHGSTTTPYTVANRINENPDLLSDNAPADGGIPFKVYYGHRGHMSLGRQLMELKRNEGQGFGLWFEKADEFKRDNGEFHYKCQGEWYRCQLACPLPDVEVSQGPFFIAGLLATPAADIKWPELRALMILPLVSHQAFLVVKSDAEREYISECVNLVRGHRLEKLYVGRTIKSWMIDGKRMEPPIFLGKRTEPRKRVITMLKDMSMGEMDKYEHKFNAPVCTPLFAMKAIL